MPMLFKRDITKPGLLAIIFFILTAPFALCYIFHHPDEAHYTNAAIAMLQNSDFLSPVYPDGSYRFIKPIFTYWSIVISYFVFGVSEFSSRLPGLTAAAIFLYIFIKQVKIITNNREIAVLAAVIAGANPLFIMSASRAIPDIWLTIFLSISALGMLRLLTGNGRHKNSLLMVYLGSALAIESKGLPAIAYSAVGIAFLLFNPWKKIRFKELFSLPLFIIALALGFGWYVAIIAKHGHEALNSFFDDQFNNRVGTSISSVFTGLFLGLLFLIAYSTPWIFFIFRKVKENFSKSKSTCFFILAWLAATLIFCMAVAPLYDRYLLPAFPLLSILIASAVVKGGWEKQGIIINRVFDILLGVLIIAGVVSLFLFGVPLAIRVISGFMATYIVLLKTRQYPVAVKIYISILSFFTLFAIIIAPFVMPHQGRQIAYTLKKKQVTSTTIINDNKVASKIRVNSGQNFHLSEENNLYNPKGAIIIKDADYNELDSKPAISDTLSFSWKNISIEELYKARKQNNLTGYKKLHSEKYYLIEEGNK